MGTPARLYLCMPNSETAEGGHPTYEDVTSKMSKVAKMSKMLGTDARLHVVCRGFKDGQERPSYGRRHGVSDIEDAAGWGASKEHRDPFYGGCRTRMIHQPLGASPRLEPFP